MRLSDFFDEHKNIALAFSGGTDSSYLLYSAVKCGADVCAYYVRSQFQPQFEADDAMRLAAQLSVRIKVIDVDVLCDDIITANPKDRCYYCKKRIFSSIIRSIESDADHQNAGDAGTRPVLIDGTNASDIVSDRPGMKALHELGVMSPLRECGITKDDVRRLSKEAGLFTWDKPSYACLATRIPCGEKITAQKLDITERSEKFLALLGFSDFRIRMRDGAALIQIPAAQFRMFDEHRAEIYDHLIKDYRSVTLDENPRSL